jgi:hypothetical protein
VTLPHSFELDVAALSRLFDDKATSYKFIFFLSYLDILRRRDFSADEPISFRDLTVEMLANSWYPHTYFKLSFGLQDKIASKLDSLNLEISQPLLIANNRSMYGIAAVIKPSPRVRLGD